LLEVVLLENLDLFEVLALLPRLIASGEVRTSRLRRWRTQRVRLTVARSSPFHGDGEIIGPTPVEIEAVPRAIQVLVPSSE
jgi:diacylglycerol kinase (ATP)